jgi:hypothetical protein
MYSGYATGSTMEDLVFDSREEEKFFSPAQCPNQIRVQLTLVANWCRGIILRVKNEGVKLNTFFHVVTTLRMHGTIQTLFLMPP